MSVISSNARTTTRSNVRNIRDAETNDEFEGIWLNFGVEMIGEDDEESTFVRLPRGVAVSDLKTRKVYDSMDPAFAAQVNLMNQIIELVQAKGLELGEGESVPINLSAQLYRRQEEAEAAPTTDNKALADSLFG